MGVDVELKLERDRGVVLSIKVPLQGTIAGAGALIVTLSGMGPCEIGSIG